MNAGNNDICEREENGKKIHLDIHFKGYLEMKTTESLENTKLENEKNPSPTELIVIIGFLY